MDAATTDPATERFLMEGYKVGFMCEARLGRQACRLSGREQHVYVSVCSVSATRAPLHPPGRLWRTLCAA